MERFDFRKENFLDFNRKEYWITKLIFFIALGLVFSVIGFGSWSVLIIALIIGILYNPVLAYHLQVNYEDHLFYVNHKEDRPGVIESHLIVKFLNR